MWRRASTGTKASSPMRADHIPWLHETFEAGWLAKINHWSHRYKWYINIFSHEPEIRTFKGITHKIVHKDVLRSKSVEKIVFTTIDSREHGNNTQLT
jgi:hypothetical protein